MAKIVNKFGTIFILWYNVSVRSTCLTTIENGRVENIRKVSKDGTLPLNEEQMLALYYCVRCRRQGIFFLMWQTVISIMKGGFFMRKLDSKTLIIASFLIALNIVLSRIITIPGIISFGGFPIVFGGIVLGPVAGFIIGAVGDIVSFLVRPTGAFMPHFVLTSALTGFIPGVITMLLKNKLESPKLWKIFVAILVGQVITSVVMVPYFRMVLFSHPFVLTMAKAASNQLLSIPIYTIIIKGLVEGLYRAGTLQRA